MLTGDHDQAEELNHGSTCGMFARGVLDQASVRYPIAKIDDIPQLEFLILRWLLDGTHKPLTVVVLSDETWILNKQDETRFLVPKE